MTRTDHSAAGLSLFFFFLLPERNDATDCLKWPSEEQQPGKRRFLFHSIMDIFSEMHILSNGLVSSLFVFEESRK